MEKKRKKLLYYCSYVPDAVLKAAGFEMISMHELAGNIKGSVHLPGSPCSFIRFCCDIPYEEYDGVIFANCCNSSQRMYDYVKHRHPDIFTYIMEGPRDGNEKWDCQGLFHALQQYFQSCVRVEPEIDKQHGEYSYPFDEKKDFLILSSALHQGYIEELERIFAGFTCKILSCGSQKRGIMHLTGNAVACPRMLDFFPYIGGQIASAKGVILVSIKNCDPMLFAYPGIREICREKKVPCLMIEEEYGTMMSSRSCIRYEAFLEGFGWEQRNNDK